MLSHTIQCKCTRIPMYDVTIICQLLTVVEAVASLVPTELNTIAANGLSWAVMPATAL